MGNGYIVQSIALKDSELVLDPDKSILICRSGTDEKKKRWAKKLSGVWVLGAVLEDDEKFYVACESGEASGQFLALHKDSGVTGWYIPGKCFLQVLFEGYLFLIFIDDRMQHYLLKVDTENGTALWHHRVDDDLMEYSFTRKRIRLGYASGKIEHLSVADGREEKG